jgi:hypothetical protein
MRSSPRRDPACQEQIATYIAQLSGELAELAHAAGLDLLAYFLRMSQAEANQLSQQGKPNTSPSLKF